jgi:hypothetical protein
VAIACCLFACYWANWCQANIINDDAAVMTRYRETVDQLIGLSKKESPPGHTTTIA